VKGRTCLTSIEHQKTWRCSKMCDWRSGSMHLPDMLNVHFHLVTHRHKLQRLQPLTISLITLHAQVNDCVSAKQKNGFKKGFFGLYHLKGLIRVTSNIHDLRASVFVWRKEDGLVLNRDIGRQIMFPLHDLVRSELDRRNARSWENRIVHNGMCNIGRNRREKNFQRLQRITLRPIMALGLTG
jgi:hypothetical protein